MAIVCEKIKSKIIKLKKSERKITIALQTRGNKKNLIVTTVVVQIVCV